jgi:hypothetical protein
VTLDEARTLKVGNVIQKPGYLCTMTFWVTKIRRGGFTLRTDGGNYLGKRITWYVATEPQYEGQHIEHLESFWKDARQMIPISHLVQIDVRYIRRTSLEPREGFIESPIFDGLYQESDETMRDRVRRSIN